MLNEDHLVSKSRSLLEMKNSGYNVGELKILDTYLSRINPLDPSTSKVAFSKAEYCELMGIDSGKVRAKQLEKYTSHFLGNVVTMPRPDGKKGYVQKVLFTTAEYDAEDEIITLECNTDDLIFNTFFNIENIGYVKYILKNTIHFSSRYSFKLYMLLKSKLPTHEFQMDLKELKEQLEANANRYESFKFFNSDVLKKAQEEINEKTDTYVEYEKITKRRLTVAVKFKFRLKSVEKGCEGQEEFFDPASWDAYVDECKTASAPDKNDPMASKYEFWSGACDGEFNTEQIKELSVLAADHIEFTLNPDERDMMIYDYLRRKYVSLANRKITKSRYGMMKFIVSNDK